MNHPLVMTTVALAIFNGLFSSYVGLAFLLHPVWYPVFLPARPGPVFFGASLIVSTATLVLGGVPAAIYERVTSSWQTTDISRSIWLAGVFLLTLPAIQSRFFKVWGRGGLGERASGPFPHESHQGAGCQSCCGAVGA